MENSKIKNITQDFINLSKDIYGDEFIPMHRPIFIGNEKDYLIECIDSNFVSSVGQRVNDFEDGIAKLTKSRFAIAAVNGTSALHTALKVLGIKSGNEVITQALTFVATCNAIRYLDAYPIFIDVDRDTMGLSPKSLKNFLETNAIKKLDGTYNKFTKNKISACVPMHTFGFPCRIDEIKEICLEWNIALVEDSAESLGSYFKNQHTGTYGSIGIFSFNGNKIITTGGGGMLVTDNQDIAEAAKHISTTSKANHPFEFFHDQTGFNYRMPNLNAALGCAQLEKLDAFLDQKKKVHDIWKDFFNKNDIEYVTPIKNAKANFWLNTIIFSSEEEKDFFIKTTNNQGVMTRPVWTLMNKLPMHKNYQTDNLKNSKWLEKRVVNISSSVPLNFII